MKMRPTTRGVIQLLLFFCSSFLLMGGISPADGQQPGGAAERKREQARQKDLQAIQSRAILKPDGIELENICDVQMSYSLSAYCICDSLTLQDATDARCTVFNVTDQNDPIWESFRTQANLQDLQLNVNAETDGRLNFLPAVALRHLTLLSSLQLRGADIDALTPHTLADAPSLVSLKLNQNKIRHIRPFAFQGLNKLTDLELSHNWLSSLERGAFAGLESLRSLLLDGNNISLIEDSVFLPLTHLIELDLSGNRIGVLTGDTLQGLKHLRRLSLRGNDLSIVGDLTFAYTPQLRRLDLSVNRLQVVRDRAFAGLTKLDHLNLTSNQLTTLDQSALAPVWLNFINTSMAFYIQGNPLRCDCRLFWVKDLHGAAFSKGLKAGLEQINCSSDENSPPGRNVLEYLQLVNCLATTTTTTTESTTTKTFGTKKPTRVSNSGPSGTTTASPIHIQHDEHPPQPQKNAQINDSGASLQLSSQQSKPSAQQSDNLPPTSSVNVASGPSAPSSTSSLFSSSAVSVFLLNYFIAVSSLFLVCYG